MGVVSGFFKIVFRLPSLIQDAIKNANDKKQQKEADKVDKKFQRDTQNLDQDNDKSELGDIDDLGNELEQIIEDAMSEHEAISAEMQESINTLRGFAPERIDYPNDTPDLVKQFTNANGGNMDAATAALRNTGYLMQGQQQIGQTVQLTGQAVASMAQNMDQSIQTTMDFMEEVPETIRDVAENSHAELEEFLKKWRRGQDRQFAFLNALKSVATWPLRAGKFTISRTEAAMIRAKVIQQTLAEILGKSAAFKVILNELAKKFPFIAKLQKGFYNIVNFIPNLTGFLTDTFKDFKANLKYIGFELKGNLLNLGDKTGFVKRETLSPEDTHLLEDWEAIHGNKKLQKQRSEVAKKGAGAIEQLQKYHGFNFTEEEIDAIRSGDSSVFIDKVRKQAKLDDKEWRPLLELEQLARDLVDEDSTFNYTLGKDTSNNIWGRIQDLIYAKKSTGKNLPELYKALLDEISKESLKAHGNQNKLQALTTINNLIQGLNKDKYLSGHGMVMDYDSMSSQRILADYYGVGALTDAYQYTYEADKLKTQINSQDNEKLQKALDNQNLEFDENGKIVVKDRNKLSWNERQDQAYERSIEGTEALGGLLGAPDNRGSRREEFINQMIRKYHLDYQSVKKEFEKHPDCTKDPSKGGNIMFWENTVTEGKTTHTYFGIRKKWFDAWCKAHPEVGFKESQNDYIDISVDVGGYHVETRNQGTNAYREFDENGNSVDVDKIKPQNAIKPQGKIQDDSNAGSVEPTKANVIQAPKIETPKEEAVGSVNNQLPPELEMLDAKPSISNDVIDPVTGTMLRKAASDYYAQKQREQTEALRRQEKAREEALLEEAAQMTGMSVETIRANYNRLHKKHGVTLDEYIQTIKNINNLQEEVITKGTQKAAELDKKQTQLTNEIEKFTQAHSSVKDAGSSGIKSSWDNIKTILTDVDQQHRDIVWDPDFEVNDPSVKGGKRKGAFVKVSKRSAEKILINAEFEKPEIKSAILKAKANQAWERGEAYTPQDNKDLEEHDKETNRQIAKLLRQQEQTNNSLQAIAALIEATKSTPSIVYNNVTQEGNNSQKDTAQLLDINLDQYVR